MADALDTKLRNIEKALGGEEVYPFDVQDKLGWHLDYIESLIKGGSSSGTKLYRHHFDVVLTPTDFATIPVGYQVHINVNALSTSKTPWATLSELDGGGFIVSAFGTIPNDFSYIFELKLFYSALNNGTLLLNIHDLNM